MKKIFAVLMFLGVIGALSFGVTGCDNKTKTPTPVTKTPAATDGKTTEAPKTTTEKKTMP